MVAPLRHRQTKEAETDMFDLQPPRHISTLHETGQCLCYGCPQLAEADIRAFGRHSGFDPFRSSARLKFRSAANP